MLHRGLNILWGRPEDPDTGARDLPRRAGGSRERQDAVLSSAASPAFGEMPFGMKAQRGWHRRQFRQSFGSASVRINGVVGGGSPAYLRRAISHCKPESIDDVFDRRSADGGFSEYKEAVQPH